VGLSRRLLCERFVMRREIRGRQAESNDEGVGMCYSCGNGLLYVAVLTLVNIAWELSFAFMLSIPSHTPTINCLNGAALYVYSSAHIDSIS